MYRELIKRAHNAKERAYAPYSGFKVGAALLTEQGEIFTGCNIENASYGAAICAERVAVFNAVSNGKRSFTKLAVTAVPCGMCRQVLSEFCSGDFEIIVAETEEKYTVRTLEDILPEAFGLSKGD